jgi:hypothetical protein
MSTFGRGAAFCIAIGLGVLMTGCGGDGNASTGITQPTVYVLTVESTGPASGVAISASPADLTNKTTGSTGFTLSYDAGTSVMLTAPASFNGDPFSSWTGCATVAGAQCTVTLNAYTTVTANYTVISTVMVNESVAGPPVTGQLLGMNMATWYDIVTNKAGILSAFQTAGIKAVRWPGGSWSDVYHWQTNSNCAVAPYALDPGQPDSNDTFANFVNDLAIPAGLDVTLTADYGTNPTCTGGGEPSEAAAWVSAALANGITVSRMTVGNEVFGSVWEEDLHSSPNNPSTYAAAVGNSASNGYYEQIKTASPNTMVGVDVDAGESAVDGVAAGWDPIVLANAQYDFVEIHFYPKSPGQDNDTFLVQQAAQQLTTDINIVKSELKTAGKPDTPIYLGEVGGPSAANENWSITQGLYAGQVLGEMMNDGVARVAWWMGFGNCYGVTGNDSSSLYGWQDFGALNVFSDGPSDTACPGLGPVGTMSPTARAFQLFSNVAVTGENVLTATVAGDTTDVRAYAATHSGGQALVLFNLNETTSQPVTVTLSGKVSSSGVSVETYDKAIYDLSGSPTGTPPDPAGTSTWAPPTTTTLGAQNLPLSLTLAPWSMNVVIVQ